MLSKLIRVKGRFQELIAKYKPDVYTPPKRGSLEHKVKNVELSMRQRLQENLKKAQKNIESNTPRIAGGLFILFSIPQFYYLYDLLWRDYEDQEFYYDIKKSIDWINLKTFGFSALIFGLEAVKFFDRKAKNKIPRYYQSYLFLLIPLVFSLGSISFFDNIDKKFLIPSLVSDGTLLMIEAKLTNEAVIPYWFFNIKYHVHVFDIVNITFLYYAMKRLSIDMEKNKHKYIKLEETSTS